MLLKLCNELQTAFKISFPPLVFGNLSPLNFIMALSRFFPGNPRCYLYLNKNVRLSYTFFHHHLRDWKFLEPFLTNNDRLSSEMKTKFVGELTGNVEVLPWMEQLFRNFSFSGLEVYKSLRIIFFTDILIENITGCLVWSIFSVS